MSTMLRWLHKSEGDATSSTSPRRGRMQSADSITHRERSLPTGFEDAGSLVPTRKRANSDFGPQEEQMELQPMSNMHKKEKHLTKPPDWFRPLDSPPMSFTPEGLELEIDGILPEPTKPRESEDATSDDGSLTASETSGCEDDLDMPTEQSKVQRWRHKMATSKSSSCDPSANDKPCKSGSVPTPSKEEFLAQMRALPTPSRASQDVHHSAGVDVRAVLTDDQLQDLVCFLIWSAAPSQEAESAGCEDDLLLSQTQLEQLRRKCVDAAGKNAPKTYLEDPESTGFEDDFGLSETQLQELMQYCCASQNLQSAYGTLSAAKLKELRRICQAENLAIPMSFGHAHTDDQLQNLVRFFKWSQRHRGGGIDAGDEFGLSHEQSQELKLYSSWIQNRHSLVSSTAHSSDSLVAEAQLNASFEILNSSHTSAKENSPPAKVDSSLDDGSLTTNKRVSFFSCVSPDALQPVEEDDLSLLDVHADVNMSQEETLLECSFAISDEGPLCDSSPSKLPRSQEMDLLEVHLEEPDFPGLSQAQLDCLHNSHAEHKRSPVLNPTPRSMSICSADSDECDLRGQLGHFDDSHYGLSEEQLEELSRGAHIGKTPKHSSPVKSRSRRGAASRCPSLELPRLYQPPIPGPGESMQECLQMAPLATSPRTLPDMLEPVHASADESSCYYSMVDGSVVAQDLVASLAAGASGSSPTLSVPISLPEYQQHTSALGACGPSSEEVPLPQKMLSRTSSVCGDRASSVCGERTQLSMSLEKECTDLQDHELSHHDAVTHAYKFDVSPNMPRVAAEPTSRGPPKRSRSGSSGEQLKPGFMGVWSKGTINDTGDRLTWHAGGPGGVSILHTTNAGMIACELGDNIYTGQLRSDGQIHWDDGDIWTREAPQNIMERLSHWNLLNFPRAPECEGDSSWYGSVSHIWAQFATECKCTEDRSTGDRPRSSSRDYTEFI